MIGEPIPDEIRRFLEVDIQDDDDRNRLLDNPAYGTEVAILITATDGNYPTVANAFYKCTIVGLDGFEREGGTWVQSGGGGNVYAANLGTAIPPLATFVLGVKVPNRWAFLYNG